MSDTLNTTIVIQSEDRASAAISKIEANLKALENQIKKTFGNFRMPGLDRMARGANQAAASAKAMDADARALRSRIVGELRVSRLRQKAAAADYKARVSAERAEAASLKTKIVGMTKVARLRDRFTQDETRAKAAAEKAEMRAIRERFAFGARMARQRAGEERAAAREEAASFRERARLDKYRVNLRARYERDQERDRNSARSDMLHHGRDGARRASDAWTRSTRGAAAAGVAGAVGTGVMLRKSFGAEADIDSSEINSRIYAGLSKNAARELRDKWAAPLAESLGVGTDKLLNSYTDAIKLGIPTSGAKEFASLATKTSEAWNVPFETVSDTLGTINSLLTSSGQVFDFGKLKSVANSLQHLAAKQSTTPEKMISFLKRGAGGAQVLGMSQESGLAFGSASTSLGNDAAESGRLLDYMASRIIDLPKLVEKKGDEADEAKDLVKALGYTGVKDLDTRRRSDPDAFLPDFMQRFSGIADPSRREKALRFFAGKEWLGEMGRMVTGGSTYKEAAQLAKESKNLDAIGEVWELHKQKMIFTGKQFSSGWRNILGEFGKELSPLARQAGDYFLDWSAKLRQGGLAERFKASIQGFIQGLGFQDFKEMLHGMFGKPGEGEAGSIKAWADAARGFAQGLRDVGSTIAGFFRVFTGGNAAPEVIGQWTGRILAFSLACVIAAPVVSILGSLGAALGGFALAATAAWRLLKGAGIVGGATGAAGAAAGAAAKAGKGSWLGRLFSSRAGLGVAGAAAGGAMLGMSKEESDTLMLRLGEWAKQRNGALPDQKPAPADPATGLTDELRALREALDGNAKVLKQNFEDGSSGLVPLIRKASFGPDDAVGEFKRGLERLGAKIEMAGLGGSERPRLIGRRGVPETIAPPPPRVLSPPRVFGNVPGILFGRPGAALDRFGMINRHGIIGGGRIGGGSGGSGMVGFGANPGAYKPLLDHIARSEGTANRPGGGYNTSLDYGRWTGGEKNLSGMTLDEIDRLQTGMLAHPENRARYGNGLGSSALGRYQIVRKTLRSLRRQLGLNGSELYDPAMQDRLAAELARQRGANSTLGQEWASLRGGKLGTAIDLARQVPRGASTTPGARPPGADAPDAASGNVLDRMRSLRTTGRVIGEQCVALAKAAVGVTGSVREWRKGVGAEAGTLVPGTPVATFLNRDGSQSSRYAGGGIGTMGARLDHAGVFQSYLKDKDGKTIGMRLAEQFKGSAGVRSKDYFFGKGWGEANGSNYHAVLGPDGAPLGGDRNPMSAKALAQPSAEALASSVPSASDRVGKGWMKGAGGNSQAIHAPITIQGGNSDPESLAQLVQKRLQETTRTRQHDLDYQSI